MFIWREESAQKGRQQRSKLPETGPSARGIRQKCLDKHENVHLARGVRANSARLGPKPGLWREASAKSACTSTKNDHLARGVRANTATRSRKPAIPREASAKSACLSHAIGCQYEAKGPLGSPGPKMSNLLKKRHLKKASAEH